MMIRFLLLLTLGLAGAALSTAGIQASVLYYTNGHADIGLDYQGGVLSAHWHGTLSGGGTWNLPLAEYGPEEVVARVAAIRMSGSQSTDYLGVPTGTPIYVAGLISYQPWLGFGAEELNGADWVGDFTIRLTGWEAPSGGNFAMYTTNSPGTSTIDVYLSTYDPMATNDPWGLGGQNIFGIGVGGHDHYQFGFTTPGYYAITLEWTGQHVTEGLKTATGTFGFLVVPEPSRMLLVALALVGLVLRRTRRT